MESLGIPTFLSCLFFCDAKPIYVGAKYFDSLYINFKNYKVYLLQLLATSV